MKILGILAGVAVVGIGGYWLVSKLTTAVRRQAATPTRPTLGIPYTPRAVDLPGQIQRAIAPSGQSVEPYQAAAQAAQAAPSIIDALTRAAKGIGDVISGPPAVPDANAASVARGASWEQQWAGYAGEDTGPTWDDYSRDLAVNGKLINTGTGASNPDFTGADPFSFGWGSDPNVVPQETAPGVTIGDGLWSDAVVAQNTDPLAAGFVPAEPQTVETPYGPGPSL